jgi:hypothetical protein
MREHPDDLADLVARLIVIAEIQAEHRASQRKPKSGLDPTGLLDEMQRMSRLRRG